MSSRTITLLSISFFAALLLWGVYALIIYLGMPVHGAVFLSREQAAGIAEACAQTAYWCRGWASLFPFLTAIFHMGRPFYAYAIVSFVLYGGLLAVQGYKTGHFTLRLRLSAAHVIAGFVLSVWLFGTLFSIGSLDRGPQRNDFRRFYEPRREIYTHVEEDALAELRRNYESLLERGCLREIGFLEQHGNARVYDMSFFCMQQSLFTRAGTQIALIAILFLNFLVAGRLILRRFRMDAHSPLLELGFSAGVGSFAWVIALWIIAVLGLLQPWLTRTLFFGFPLLAFPHTLYWLRSAWGRRWEIGDRFSHVQTLLLWLLVSYFALNFLNVIRPFPIGWDDLGSYLNRPHLLASYGSFIRTISKFEWEYLAGLAFSLFDYENVTGATFAMIVNWGAGVLAVLSVFLFARTFLGPRAGLLSSVLYYFLPMVGHFSFADMKIDNATFFTSTLSVFAVFLYLFGTPGLEKKDTYRGDWRILVLAGALASFGFAIKPTAVMTILMILIVLAGVYFGISGFAGMTIFSFSVLIFQALNVQETLARLGFVTDLPHSTLRLIVALSFAFGGMAVLAIGIWLRRNQIRPFFHALVPFVVAMAVFALPWMAHNAWSHGRVNIHTLLNYANYSLPQISLTVPSEEALERYAHMRFLPPELAVDRDHPECNISTRAEELDRYWGYREGWTHYLTLPWRSVMSVDIAGYYVTLIPALLLAPLLLLLPFFWRKESQWLRYLFAGSMVLLLQWMFVGNGVIWYGLGMFLGFVIALEVLVSKAPDKQSRILAATLIGASILVCLLARFWQFDVQRNLFEYPLGKASADTIREVTIPHYDDIRDMVLERHASMPDRPYTYRIGTFIPYFIPRNIEVLPVADHQLGTFNCMNQERDHALTLERLKALGFNGIIFDTNTATIESDPEGTLHQKVRAFLNFISDPDIDLDLIINDPARGIVYIQIP